MQRGQMCIRDSYVSRYDKLLESGGDMGGRFGSLLGSWLGSVSALAFAACVGLLGPLLYWITLACSRLNRARPNGVEP